MSGVERKLSHARGPTKRARAIILAFGVLLALGLVVAAFAGAGADQSGLPGTEPAPAATGTLHAGSLQITAAGDYSSDRAAAGVLERIAAVKPDVHLAVGDLSYGTPGQEGKWCDFVKSTVGRDIPFELVSGNHESNGENGNIAAFAACLPNRLPGIVGTYAKQYYVDVPLDHPLARIILISPGFPFRAGPMSYAKGSTDYDWTAAAIDGAHAAGIPWVIVGMHTVCLTIGEKACEPGPDIMNLLVSRHVDVVLSGHEHLYQRTKQLAISAGCPQLEPKRYNSACVSDAGTSMRKGAGTVFVTAGTGGKALRPADLGHKDAPYFAAHASADSNPSHGFADLVLTPTRLDYRFVATDSTYTDGLTISSPG